MPVPRAASTTPSTRAYSRSLNKQPPSDTSTLFIPRKPSVLVNPPIEHVGRRSGQLKTSVDTCRCAPTFVAEDKAKGHMRIKNSTAEHMRLWTYKHIGSLVYRWTRRLASAHPQTRTETQTAGHTGMRKLRADEYIYSQDLSGHWHPYIGEWTQVVGYIGGSTYRLSDTLEFDTLMEEDVASWTQRWLKTWSSSRFFLRHGAEWAIETRTHLDTGGSTSS